MPKSHAFSSPTLQAEAFINESLSKASWLIRNLDRRADSILKVATEIVRHQEAFFEHGVFHLRPLDLKTIANAIGVHESTVSRVTSNKYMQSPHGAFELKYFFTTAIAFCYGGNAHSAEAVRQRILPIVRAESPDAVLSDEDIVVEFKKIGIYIARRTVAKYREVPSLTQITSQAASRRFPA